MPDRTRELHEEWRLLDQVARQAADSLQRHLDESFVGRRTPPELNAFHEVSELRRRSLEKLKELTEHLANAKRS